MKTIINTSQLENNHVEFLLENNSLNYKRNTVFKNLNDLYKNGSSYIFAQNSIITLNMQIVTFYCCKFFTL